MSLLVIFGVRPAGAGADPAAGKRFDRTGIRHRRTFLLTTEQRQDALTDDELRAHPRNSPNSKRYQTRKRLQNRILDEPSQ